MFYIKPRKWFGFYAGLSLALILILLFIIWSLGIPRPTPDWQEKYTTLLKQVRQDGQVSIIVGFAVDGTPSSENEIIRARNRLIDKLEGLNVTITTDTLFIPYIVLTVDELAL